MLPNISMPVENDKIKNEYSIKDWLTTISNLNIILNKKQPTFYDFKYFYPSDSSAGESEYALQADYCKKILKVEPDSQKCKEFAAKIFENPQKSPSYFLIDVKRQISEKPDSTIEIYLDPRIDTCTKEEKDKFENIKEIKGILVIDNIKIKKAIFKVPCTEDSMIDFGRINSIVIDGKTVW